MEKEEILKKLDVSKLPQHIAIIMDGNRRWAKSRNLPIIAGHKAGVDSVRTIVEAANKIGIKILTLYAFSTENWQRSKTEVNALMFLLKTVLRKYRQELFENGVRLKVSGDVGAMPGSVQSEINSCVERLKNGKKLLLNIALNYGGRQEIISAVNRIITENAGKIDGEKFSKYLYTHPLPDPDLIIRTSGEMRLSNFLLWQSAYSEFYITKALWPDFRQKEFVTAIIDYQERDRRFGKD